VPRVGPVGEQSTSPAPSREDDGAAWPRELLLARSRAGPGSTDLNPASTTSRGRRRTQPSATRRAPGGRLTTRWRGWTSQRRLRMRRCRKDCPERRTGRRGSCGSRSASVAGRREDAAGAGVRLPDRVRIVQTGERIARIRVPAEPFRSTPPLVIAHAGGTVWSCEHRSRDAGSTREDG